MADIDIDFADRESALLLLEHVPASMIKDGRRERHVSGVYFQNIPVNPMDGLAAYDYRDAEERGYFKIDFLNNSIYEGVRDEKHLIKLLNTEPMWELLLEPDVVSYLSQISEHIDVLQVIQPRSIMDLAVCLALIRPAKRHLLNQPRHKIDREIWDKADGGYYYKKSHAIAYAASIIVQLNLFVEKIYAA